MESLSMVEYAYNALDLRDMDESELPSRSASYPVMSNNGSAISTGGAVQYEDDYLRSRWSQTAKFLHDLTVRKAAVSDEILRYRASLLDYREQGPLKAPSPRGPQSALDANPTTHPASSISLPTLHSAQSEPHPPPSNHVVPGFPKPGLSTQPSTRGSSRALLSSSGAAGSASLDVLLESVLQRSTAVSTKLVQSCALPAEGEKDAQAAPSPSGLTKFMSRKGLHSYPAAGGGGGSMRDRARLEGGRHHSQHSMDVHPRTSNRQHAHHNDDHYYPRNGSNSDNHYQVRQGSSPMAAASPPASGATSPSQCRSPTPSIPNFVPTPRGQPWSPPPQPLQELQQQPEQPEAYAGNELAPVPEPRPNGRRRSNRLSSSGCKLPQQARRSATFSRGLSRSLDGSPEKLPKGIHAAKTRTSYAGAKPDAGGRAQSICQAGGVHLPRLIQQGVRRAPSSAAAADGRAAVGYSSSSKSIAASASGSSNSSAADVSLRETSSASWRRTASNRQQQLQRAGWRSGSGGQGVASPIMSPTGKSSWAKSTTTRELVFTQF